MRFLLLALALTGWAVAADPKWLASAGAVVTRDAKGNITGLDLRSSWNTDSDLQSIARLPHLTHLDLSETRITDQGMQRLKGATGLVELNLYYAEQITDEGMAAVKGWKNLKRVNVRGTGITDTTLEHLSSITGLESLDVGYAQVTDVGLDHLASLPNLKELMIGGNKLTDVGLQSLRHLRGLRSLDLGGVQRTDSGLWSVSLTDFGIEAIASLRELRELRLDGMPVSARSLQKLKGLIKLERIGFQGCRRVRDDAVPVLAAWPNLQVLDLKGTEVTTEGLASLRKAKPNAVVFHGPWQGPVMARFE